MTIVNLSAVKTGLQSSCDTSHSRVGVNQMWILKNSKDLLEYIQSRSLSSCTSIKTFDFSALYSTIPGFKLQYRIRNLVQLCFFKNCQRKYKYICSKKAQILVCKNKHSNSNVFWNWYHQHAWVLDWQHICYVWRTSFSTENRHTYGHKLHSTSRWLVPSFVWGMRHTGSSHEKR